ncbi:hypothetical protein [Spirosoma montaniterrae]|uniref:Outer membrane protein beta-barrel domain-containing protein n=1 Tax=Spirosoma montaniterrae TaxID=1178516 RepID=A0A1P9WSV3_9BACT|nr:hypothetical protein [Spirosoma montaniterrae]AQG78465.1 hypothetical protein AWR27_03395 [Spirosoma montaniterrae]
MRKILVALFTLLSVCSFAQSPVATRLSSGIDLGMGYTKDNYNPSFAYYQLLNLGEKKRFSVGWTFRFAPYYGDNLNFYTAPARLTREKSGFSALAAPLVERNIDTVRFDFITATSANLGIRVQVNLGIVDIGASADLLGITYGRWRTATYRSSTGLFQPDSSGSVPQPFRGANNQQRGYPTRFNVRMLGDNDIGTLNTEVYARLKITQNIKLKLGYQWLTVGVTMQNRDVVSDNNRFRHRAGLAYAALTFPLFN